MASKKDALAQVQEAEKAIRQRDSSRALSACGKAKEQIKGLREPAPDTPPPPPTEEPPPPPPSDGGTVLFADHFKTIPPSHQSGGAGWYGQYNTGRVYTTPDGMRSEIRQGEREKDTNLEMAQISGRNTQEGDNIWVAHRFRWPSGHQANPSWETMHEWHDSSNAGLTGGSFSPAVGIFVMSRKLYLKNGKGSPTYWSGPTLEIDKWYELIYRVKFAKSNGEIEVWFEGKQVATWSGLTTNTGKSYLKLGCYRAGGTSGTSLTEHSKLVLATSRGAAASG